MIRRWWILFLEKPYGSKSGYLRIFPEPERSAHEEHDGKTTHLPRDNKK